jgi:hypothetical protein
VSRHGFARHTGVETRRAYILGGSWKARPHRPTPTGLYSRVRRRRAAAFDVLHAWHKGGVYRYLLRDCGNAFIPTNCFQDT